MSCRVCCNLGTKTSFHWWHNHWTFIKTMSVSKHQDHSGVPDHMPKGNFVIPWRRAKKKRERKLDSSLGSDVERRNVPIFSRSSVSATGLFLALFKAVEIQTCWHHSLLGIHWWEIKKSVWVWYEPPKIAQVKTVAFDCIGTIIQILKEIIGLSHFNLNVGGCF